MTKKYELIVDDYKISEGEYERMEALVPFYMDARTLVIREVVPRFAHITFKNGDTFLSAVLIKIDGTHLYFTWWEGDEQPSLERIKEIDNVVHVDELQSFKDERLYTFVKDWLCGRQDRAGLIFNL